MRKPLALCFSLLVLCAALTGCTLHQGSASAASTSGVVLLGPSSKVRQTHFSGGAGGCETAGSELGAGVRNSVSGTGVKSFSRQPMSGAAPKQFPRPNPSAVPKNSSAAPSRKFFLKNRISKILLCKLFLVSKGLL